MLKVLKEEGLATGLDVQKIEIGLAKELKEPNIAVEPQSKQRRQQEFSFQQFESTGGTRDSRNGMVISGTLANPGNLLQASQEFRSIDSYSSRHQLRSKKQSVKPRERHSGLDVVEIEIEIESDTNSYNDTDTDYEAITTKKQNQQEAEEAFSLKERNIQIKLSDLHLQANESTVSDQESYDLEYQEPRSDRNHVYSTYNVHEPSQTGAQTDRNTRQLHNQRKPKLKSKGGKGSAIKVKGQYIRQDTPPDFEREKFKKKATVTLLKENIGGFALEKGGVGAIEQERKKIMSRIEQEMIEDLKRLRSKASNSQNR